MEFFSFAKNDNDEKLITERESKERILGMGIGMYFVGILLALGVYLNTKGYYPMYQTRFRVAYTVFGSFFMFASLLTLLVLIGLMVKINKQ